MEIKSVFDASFAQYGKVVENLKADDLLEALQDTPCPKDGTVYEPGCAALEAQKSAKEIELRCYGGMPIQIGYCNGYNKALNCLEYHRDSEFNLGTEDFILLLARQEEIENGLLDTARVKAFRVPAGVLVEVFATTLHYAPCHCDASKGFRVLVALPWLTNTERPDMENRTPEDTIMTARNKWLLAHPESSEAKNGAKVGLTGEHIDIARYL